MLYHPGVLPGSTVEDTEAARTWVGLGAGRIITPIKCERGWQRASGWRAWVSCVSRGYGEGPNPLQAAEGQRDRLVQHSGARGARILLPVTCLSPSRFMPCC